MIDSYLERRLRKIEIKLREQDEALRNFKNIILKIRDISNKNAEISNNFFNEFLKLKTNFLNLRYSIIKLFKAKDKSKILNDMMKEMKSHELEKIIEKNEEKINEFLKFLVD